MSTKAHIATFRIYYEDTDAGGIVYYANYLKFAERARTEWLREKGFEQEKLRNSQGIAIVVRRCECEFLSSAKLDDQIVIETRLHEIGKVRMTMQQAIKRAGKTLFTMNVELACIDILGKPVRWPKEMTDTFV